MTDPATDPATAPAASAAAEPRKLTRTWLPWIPLFLVLVVALAAGTLGARPTPTNEERALAIAKTIKCPVCQGETVAESNADTSKEIRAGIAKQVDEGRTDDEIRSFYAARWGDAVLLTPTGSGATGLVWILPVVVLVCSLGALGFAFRRWADRSPVAATDADRALVADALAHAHAHADAAHADGGTDDPDDDARDDR